MQHALWLQRNRVRRILRLPYPSQHHGIRNVIWAGNAEPFRVEGSDHVWDNNGWLHKVFVP